MSETPARAQCPHCDQPLQLFKLPADAGYSSEFHLACFNDECPYYVRGWEWMDEKYGVKASYRFRVDPDAGTPSPIAVWSPDALKDRILEADGLSGEPDEAGEPGEADEVDEPNEAGEPGKADEVDEAGPDS